MRKVVMAATATAIVILPVFGQSLALGAIHVYQDVVAPIAGRAGIECRFAPSCSRYGEIAIARDGLVAGGWRTLARIVRCGPWTSPGTVDEP